MKTFDLIVIGGGPGGYVAAIRAAQLEIKTAIIERARLGGMCLNWGCVPARRLMESARVYDHVLHSSVFGVEGIDPAAVHFNWKKSLAEKDRIVTKLVKGVEYLMKKNRVEVINGEARLSRGGGVYVGEEEYRAEHLIIATGSRPDRTPVAGLPAKLVTEIDDLYAASDIPERIVLAGGDTVACEMASMLHLIGKTVTMVAPDEKLLPWLDESTSRFILDRFRKDGIRVLLSSRFSGGTERGVRVGDEEIECDLVVNCSRRAAVLPDLDDMPLDLDRGFVRTNEYMQTSVPGVYAVGDVTGSIFAHVASAQGVCAVHHISGLKEPMDYKRMPMTLYMYPEISSVGLTEEQLKKDGVDYVKGEFPMSVNSKALVEGDAEGFVKILADQKYGEVLGVHVVASRATDMIAEAAMCMKTEGTLDDLARVVHAHPTVSETFLEAGFKAMGKPLHV
jgi:dihydrolipoamide dehydrogenase